MTLYFHESANHQIRVGGQTIYKAYIERAAEAKRRILAGSVDVEIALKSWWEDPATLPAGHIQLGASFNSILTLSNFTLYCDLYESDQVTIRKQYEISGCNFRTAARCKIAKVKDGPLFVMEVARVTVGEVSVL